MVEIRLHEVIDSESNRWIYEWYGMNRPFSLDALQEVMDANPGKELKLNIHCDGGQVEEGLAIYDALRTSGRKIRCNVEGKCHSMAITLLLAAPKELRTANPNSQFLIHEVQGGVTGSTSAVAAYAEEMQSLQDRILDIYADRTGESREVLEAAMKEQITRDSDYMLEHGFIGAINKYNTNQATQSKMNLFERLKNLVSEAETEEQNAATAEPAANTAELEAMTAERDALNARIADMEAQHTETLNARQAELDAANAQIADLNAAAEQTNARIAELEQEIVDLKAQIASHEEPAQRTNEPSANEKHSAGEMSSEERKNAVREALGKLNKK